MTRSSNWWPWGAEAGWRTNHGSRRQVIHHRGGSFVCNWINRVILRGKTLGRARTGNSAPLSKCGALHKLISFSEPVSSHAKWKIASVSEDYVLKIGWETVWKVPSVVPGSGCSVVWPDPRMFLSGVPELRRGQCRDQDSPKETFSLPTTNYTRWDWNSLTPISLPFYRIGNWGPDRKSDLPMSLRLN